MKLLSCHIDNFGRLRNYNHVFADGLNTILHENGWGKSTLAAFLCAMLYGMPGGKRRGGTVPDRERYRPWQGGTYGGELIIEVDGRIFSVARTFGARESEDTFDLRDVETNLPDFRFSQSIGQDLFALDRASFLRTAMVTQQDCATETTDNILALLTDLQEQSGDMDSYETAMKRLSEASNRLTPRRRTGSLYRRAERIQLLERDASGTEDLSNRIQLCERERRQALDLEKELTGQLETYRKELESVRRMVENQSRLDMMDTAHREKQEALRNLRKEKQIRQNSTERAAAFFPGRIPEDREVEEHLQQCRILTRLEYQMQSAMLTEAEQNRLTELEEVLRDPSPKWNKSSDKPPDKNVDTSDESSVHKTGPAALWNIPIAAGGVVLLVLGGLFITIGHNPPALVTGITAIIVGLIIALVSCMRMLQAEDTRSDGFPRKKRTPVSTGEDYGHAGKAPADPRVDHLDLRDKYWDPRDEYAFLSSKEQKLEALHARWAETRRPVLSFLKELGLTPEEDLQGQLEEVRIAVKEYEAAQQRLRAAEQALRRLETDPAEAPSRRAFSSFSPPSEKPAASLLPDPTSGHHPGEAMSDPVSTLKADGLSCLPDPSLLRTLPSRIEDVQTGLLQCRREITEKDDELAKLASEQEEMEAAAEQLDALRAEQEQESAAYSQITAAAAALRRAKESLTARYADPVRRSFARYWEQITASSAANVYVDANASVSVGEMGKQRELSLFSAGYRDLAGICLRIALVDAMYPEGRGVRPPLIMDDPFTSLDDEKMKGALRLLQTASEKYQILYFTCSRSRRL